jgi:hypothetical protein
MEVRQTFRGADVPRGLIVALATSVALGLVVAGSIIAKDLTGSSAGVKATVHAAPGTVLRQDNPVQAPAALPDWIQGEITSGTSPRLTEADIIATYMQSQVNGAPVGSHTGRSSGNQSIEGPADAPQSSSAKDPANKPGYRD